jgi:DNA polymerase-3 subunit gamma/tau
LPYLVLARRYRPRDFKEVIGQGHIVTTLSNAIEMGRLSHAYLFAGPKGTGKTSVARILAKCLNCEEGTSPTPCNRCPTCLEITQGTSLDVAEIDGASNRGIDEIRALREEIRFSPAKSPYKIYIIDEVHMLTEPAFNALLKTLEEPPNHAVFIFATTDPFRIPHTILSRAQRFDFRRLKSKEIAHYLNHLAEKEGWRIEREAIDFIARKSDGSLRDALTILDQLIAYSPDKIGLKDVFDLLGVLPIERLLSLSSAIQSMNLREALKITRSLVDEGVDLNRFTKELLAHFRNLLLLSVGEEGETIEIPKEDIPLLMEQAKEFGHSRLLRVIEELGGMIQEMKGSSHPRLIFEMGLIRLTTREEGPSLEDIYKEIIGIEGRLGSREEVEAPTTEEVDLEVVRRVWAEVLRAIKTRKPTLASCLEQGELVKVEDGEIVIGFKSNFHYETCKEPQNRMYVEREAERVMGQRFKLKAILVEPDGDELRSHKEKDIGVLLEMEPMVKRAIEIFDAEIKEVKALHDQGVGRSS